MSDTLPAIELSGGPINLDFLDECLGRRIRVSASRNAWDKARKAREKIEQLLARGEVIYGVNTGFGQLCRKRVSNEELEKLQENLILSHSVGVGPPIPIEIVRWMMLFKINALLAGASGIQPACIQWLIDMLNVDAIPVVPTRGSLGASGDLAPLAHMVLPMLGRGMVWGDHEALPAGHALSAKGIKPIKLGAKDGLALINGTQMMAAYLAEIVVRARRLAKQADLIASMTLEAIRGSLKPFDQQVLALRPHRGAVEVGENVRRLMTDSEILISHAGCDKVQDPYSLRCVPQVHGACRDALRHATATLETELACVTDNPVLVGDEVVSGGNFHGEPLALVLDYLALALAEWANISERRIYLLLSGPDGLPPLLMKDTGLNSGFMIPQYTAAALVNENKVLCHPASVDSIPTSLGQEDHVSMGATSALKCRQILENAETVLSIELLCAGQALDYRLPIKSGVGPRTALDVLRQHVSHSEADRELAPDMEKCLELLRGRTLLAGVESKAGKLI